MQHSRGAVVWWPIAPYRKEMAKGNVARASSVRSGLAIGATLALGCAFAAPAAATSTTCQQSSSSVATVGSVGIGGYGDNFMMFNTWSDDSGQKAVVEPSSAQSFIGDWNGDGKDTLAIRNGAEITIYDDLAGTNATNKFLFWNPTDTVVSGDWDGDGKDSFGVVDGHHFYLRNQLGNGAPDYSFEFGRDGDLYLIGDWDGDGTDTLAAYQRNNFRFTNSQTAEGGAKPVTFGSDSDHVVAVGDWDGNGTDTPLLRDENTLAGANTYRAFNSWDPAAYDQPPANEFRAANVNNAVFAGDFDGNGSDTLGFRTFAYKAPKGDRAQVGQAGTSQLPTNANFRLRADAAAAWQQVIDLWGTQPNVTSAWRSFDVQRNLFVTRYEPSKTGGGDFCDVRKWEGVRYVRTSDLGPAAIPGTSNHGAGLSVDVSGWTGFDDPERLRFLDLARDFGWYDDEGCRVYEPWHLTYYPERDKGWSDWTPDSPIDESASKCPHQEKLPTVAPKECPYN